MNNNMFSYRRFCAMWRYDFISAYGMLVAFGVALSILWFASFGLYKLPVSTRAFYLISTCFMLVLFFVPIIMASRMFYNLRNPQERIEFLMLPASNLEKFAARFVDYVVLPQLMSLVFCVLTFFSFDGLKLFGSFSVMHIDMSLVGVVLTSLCCVQLFSMTVTVLTATLIQRYTFIISQVALSIFSAIGSRLLIGFAADGHLMTVLNVTADETGTHIASTGSGWGLPVMIIATLLVVAAGLWGSYKIFSRKTA